MSENFVQCVEVHPASGDVCSLDIAHVQHEDARVKQHVAQNGVKWPTLHEIDPAEGWNDFVTFKV